MGAEGAKVCAEGTERDVVQVQVGEAIAQHQMRRLGPVPLAPSVPLAGHDPELRRPVEMVYRVQGRRPKGVQRPRLVDGELGAAGSFGDTLIPCLLGWRVIGPTRSPRFTRTSDSLIQRWYSGGRSHQ